MGHVEHLYVSIVYCDLKSLHQLVQKHIQLHCIIIVKSNASRHPGRNILYLQYIMLHAIE